MSETGGMRPVGRERKESHSEKEGKRGESGKNISIVLGAWEQEVVLDRRVRRRTEKRKDQRKF